VKILVTGGAGFIGSHIVDQYLQLGHEVVVIDNLSTGQRDNLNPQATFHQVDITNAEAVAQVMEAEQPELINHHAAQINVRHSVEDPAFDAITNIVGSINLIEQGLAVGATKIIYASSGGAVYGEPQYIPTDEDHPINPVSHYGLSKYTVEEYLKLYGQLRDLKYVILRYANVYGPRQNAYGEAGVVAIFGQQMLQGQQPTIFGDGTDTRDYVFVDDIVEANVRALHQGDNQVLNLGTGHQTSVQEVFAAVADAVGYGGQPRYGEPRLGDITRSALNITKARELLGWEPQVSFSEGVQHTVAFLRGGLQ